MTRDRPHECRAITPSAKSIATRRGPADSASPTRSARYGFHQCSDVGLQKKALAVKRGPKGGWMRRRCVCRSRVVRRMTPEKSLGAAQPFTNEVVDGFAVDALAGQLRHHGLHDAAHILR